MKQFHPSYIPYIPSHSSYRITICHPDPILIFVNSAYNESEDARTTRTRASSPSYHSSLTPPPHYAFPNPLAVAGAFAPTPPCLAAKTAPGPAPAAILVFGLAIPILTSSRNAAPVPLSFRRPSAQSHSRILLTSGPTVRFFVRGWRAPWDASAPVVVVGLVGADLVRELSLIHI